MTKYKFDDGFIVRGFNGDISTTEEPVWDQGGAYTYQAAAAVAKVSSSSTADTSAGTGARTVLVIGLNGSYAYTEETVTLTGQTAVNTTTSFWRIIEVRVLTAGSGGTNAGDIYVGDGAVALGIPATIYCKAPVGEGQSAHGLFTVPLTISEENTTLASIHISGVGGHCADGTNLITFRLKVKQSGGVFRTLLRFDVGGTGPHTAYFPTDIYVPIVADIQLTGTSSAATPAGGAWFSATGSSLAPA